MEISDGTLRDLADMTEFLRSNDPRIYVSNIGLPSNISGDLKSQQREEIVDRILTKHNVSSRVKSLPFLIRHDLCWSPMDDTVRGGADMLEPQTYEAFFNSFLWSV